MGKKKKATKSEDREFSSNPFSDLKGFAASKSGNKPSRKLAPPVEKAAGNPVGTFSEEMELLGVRRLNTPAEENGEDRLESSPPMVEKKKPAERQTEEELFLQSVGDMQVRFADQLPEEENPAVASARRMKQLKQGKLAPEASLDLHGLQRTEIADKIGFFLQDAIYQGWRTVLIITGRGLHSEGGEAVLRKETERFLNAEGRKWVVEWGWAPKKYGGAGALVLFLRNG